VRDFATVAAATARPGSTRRRGGQALTRLAVDKLGLDSLDRRYLQAIAVHYGGGPVGVETLAAALSEQRDTLEETVEPYLMQQGLLQRTPRGRVLTRGGFAYLGLEVPRSFGQLDLLGEGGTDSLGSGEDLA
jgi:holliday junction DNA helicase RuvB